MPSKTRVERPFSGFFIYFEVSLTSQGDLLKITLRDSWGSWGFVDPAEWPKTGLLNWDSGSILSVSPWEKQQSSHSLKTLSTLINY